MLRRAVRGALALAVALLIPACDLRFIYQGQNPPPSPSPFFQFALQLPIDGDVNVLTNPELSWTAKSGALNYWLQISTTSDFSNVIWDDPTLVITSVFLQPTLTNATTYFWRIYAIMPGGGTVLAGGSPYRFQTEWGGTLPLSFSTMNPPHLSWGSFLVPTFRWWPSYGAHSYTLQVSLDSSMASLVVDLPDIHLNQVLCPVTLAPMTTYYWQVISVGWLGNVTSTPAPLQFETGP